MKNLLVKSALTLICIAFLFSIISCASAPKDIDLSNTDLIGLPVNNFCLSEVSASSGVQVSADRLLYTRLHDFFQGAPPAVFAFVRVHEINQTKGDSSTAGTSQESTVQILKTLWDDGSDLPEIIELNQHQHSPLADGNYDSIFLRKGGVYLLPLAFFDWEGSDWWYIIGDNDVLFEVDENGIIWSHSPFTGFNQFDGKDVNAASEAILDLLNDADFAIATSAFGHTMRWDYELAKVTILSVESTTSEWRSDALFRYTLESSQGEFTAISWDDDYFEIGKQYLVFLIPTEETDDGLMIASFYATLINDDGTIQGDSVFVELTGYTTDQVFDIAERAAIWYE